MSLRRLARTILAATPLPEVLLRCRAKHHVAVLGYHRILPRPAKDYPFNESVFSATPEEFARELRYLKSNLDVISLPEMLDGLRNPSLLPQRPAVITFDDGYRDNHTYALPLLREANLPATFFICTGLVGTRTIPWQEEWVCCLKRSHASRIESPFGGGDRPYELDRSHLSDSIGRFRKHMRAMSWSRIPGFLQGLRNATSVRPDEHLSEPMFLSWDEVRDLAAAGMDIGGHTRTHPLLSRIDEDTVLEEEISGCFDDLVRMLGRAPLAFAYPLGGIDYMSDRADKAIARAGFQVSFSFIHGFAPRAPRLYRLPRIHASYGDDHRSFRLRTAIAPAHR